MELEADTVDAVAFINYTIHQQHVGRAVWKRLTRSGESLPFEHMAQMAPTCSTCDFSPMPDHCLVNHRISSSPNSPDHSF